MSLPVNISTPDVQNRGAINLLRFPPVRALVRWAWFPYVFQAAMFVMFIGMSVLSWQRFAPGDVASKLYAKTNLVQLLIWGLWCSAEFFDDARAAAAVSKMPVRQMKEELRRFKYSR